MTVLVLPKSMKVAQGMGNGSEMWWPNFTFCVLLERSGVNHLQAEGEIHIIFKF